MNHTWRCRRVKAGVQCNTLNLARKQKCTACGKPRPPRRKAKHLAALEQAYPAWVELNGGESCAICGRLPSLNRRLDRDHDHRTGAPRGLLCARCNRALPSWVTAEWLRAAAAYLERPR